MVGLIDSTLREGLQGVGVELSLDRQVAVAAGSVALGLEELEVGPVGLAAATMEPGDYLARLIPRLRHEAGVRRLALWCRCLPDDIERSLALNPDVLALSIPASHRQMTSKLGKTAAEVRTLAAAALELARGRVPYLALGLEDVTRAEPNFVRQMAVLAVDHGVDRLRLADTVGISAPDEIADLVGRVREYLREAGGDGRGNQVAIGVHTHNDFGLAGANAIAALAAGADWADVSLLGLGERAGLARLEEVATYLALRRGHHYRLERLPELAQQLAGFCGREIPSWRPVVGRDVFSCETGLHLAAIQLDPASYEPFAPELVGQRRTLLYGVKAGHRAIARQWRRWQEGSGQGRKAPVAAGKNRAIQGAPAGLLAKVRQTARELRRPLTCEELQRVFLSYG
ncbi:homocitrate synthase/isopropylmalate synthase family protein [Desulfurivibrio alkaliphilus]|uniref:Pyruvate carboxyltransferase n=1 Tax=Desulfurivibrio alkaliphilus (strain DSM 19089 / UNIQEM U267 / AHT2) TaxID=589865 RepID=D6Z0A9_DESAT|nr:pyruvate carboxyltransferase [Desulfurivibrio alkaliphilus]ADH87142.1 pyruvate carboxyltransferase [Desulfurivibrio alkaliphilus AHT 2]